MPQLNAVGIVTSDMARSIAFYRALGLDVPETPGEGHVDTLLPSGVQVIGGLKLVVDCSVPPFTHWMTTLLPEMVAPVICGGGCAVAAAR